MLCVTRRTILIAGSAMLLQAESAVIYFHPEPTDSLELFVDKTGVLSGKRHRFLFSGYEGKLDMNTSVEFTIVSKSIECRDTWVKQGDLSKIEKVARTDMLAVDRYPSIRFRSTAVREISPGHFNVSGTLQIRSTSRPVEIVVERSASEYKGSAKFKLTDFGLKPPTAAFGLVGTKDEVEFRFRLAHRSE
jgi:polyisoprenoid-binding protein YceI